jgi:hypothetical protein
MRESGVWTYGIVNLVHILGVASLFGAVLVLDLRLLGAWRKVALAAISEPIVPVATVGFFIAASSGVCLLATKATEYVGNPFLYIKFPAIALGLLNVVALNSLAAWRATQDEGTIRTRAVQAGGGWRSIALLLAYCHRRRPHDRLLVNGRRDL